MNTKTRILSMILIVAVLALCFAGCDTGNPSVEPVLDSSSSDSSIPASQETDHALRYFDDSITEIAYIADGIASFKDAKTGKLGLLNGKCEIMVPAEYKEIKHCVMEGLCILTYEGGREVTFNPRTGDIEEGNLCAHGGFEYMGWDSGLQKLVCYDMDGTTYECPIDFLPEFEVFVNSVDNRELWGLVGKGGKLIAEPQWEGFGFFSGYAHISPVKKDGLWGYIDANGECVIDFAYSKGYISKDCLSYDIGKPYPAVGDYVCLMRDDYLAGMYNTKDKEYSSFTYRELIPVSDEFCIAKDPSGDWYYAEYEVIFGHSKFIK